MIARLNAWLDDRGSVILGLALILVTGLVAYGAVTNSGTDSRQDDQADAAYRAEIGLCNISSVLSEIVFLNTETAAAENAGTTIGRQFDENLELLTSPPHVSAEDGTIDCRAVVAKP